MLTCVHHVSWVRPVKGGLHQCILCERVVGPADVYPKLEDLSEEFRRRWKEHEATRGDPVGDGGEATAGKAPAGGSG